MRERRSAGAPERRGAARGSGAALLLAATVLAGGAGGAEATTAQLASYLFESLATEERIEVPPELARRVGDLSRMAVDLDPLARIHGTFALVVLGRGELLTLTAFEPPEGAAPVELAVAAFARCAVRGRCAESVAALRKLGAVKAKGKGKRLATPEAVLILSLIAQPGYAKWVDHLEVRNPVQRELFELAKRRHAATFGVAEGAPGEPTR